MATFNSLQTTDLASIFGVSSDLMGDRLDYAESLISEDDKTMVLDNVSAYQAIENDNMVVSAGPAGFQGRIDPDQKRSLIKKRIAGLIHCTDLFSSSGSRLVRM